MHDDIDIADLADRLCCAVRSSAAVYSMGIAVIGRAELRSQLRTYLVETLLNTAGWHNINIATMNDAEVAVFSE